jgi:hypothetical protein
LGYIFVYFVQHAFKSSEMEEGADLTRQSSCKAEEHSPSKVTKIFTFAPSEQNSVSPPAGQPYLSRFRVHIFHTNQRIIVYKSKIINPFQGLK